MAENKKDMTESNKEAGATLFGIPLNGTNNDSNKNNTLFGISLNGTDNNSTQNNALFGIQTTATSAEYSNNPAILQSLNLLEITLKKNTFEKSDFDTLQATLKLIPIAEISRLRPNISMSSLDNLSKKAGEFDKTQALEDSKNIVLANQQQIEKNNALLSQQEINKHMENFLNERNNLNQNLAEKNNQLNAETKSPTILKN